MHVGDKTMEAQQIVYYHTAYHLILQYILAGIF